MQTLEPCNVICTELTRVKRMRKMTCEVYLSTVVVAAFAMNPDFLRPFISVHTGTAIDLELRDHLSADHLPSGQHCFSCLEFAPSLLGNFAQAFFPQGVPAFGCVPRQPSDLFKYAELSPVFGRVRGSFDFCSSCRQPIMERDQSFPIFSFVQGDFITGTLRVEHKFLEFGHLSFGHGRPPCPSFDASFCSNFLPFHSGDHRKVIPNADPRLVQIPDHRA